MKDKGKRHRERRCPGRVVLGGANRPFIQPASRPQSSRAPSRLRTSILKVQRRRLVE